MESLALFIFSPNTQAFKCFSVLKQKLIVKMSKNYKDFLKNKMIF